MAGEVADGLVRRVNGYNADCQNLGARARVGGFGKGLCVREAGQHARKQTNNENIKRKRLSVCEGPPPSPIFRALI
jgi:hypothetical protein